MANDRSALNANSPKDTMSEKLTMDFVDDSIENPCESEAFHKTHVLKSNLTKDLVEKTYVCFVCGLEFSIKEQYLKHL
ncbi:unnamed protein product [Larinioides sclopetarius]|uniref:C2H2-type domain-containing protein n=1 Tax=Larinioides sclopetarius TaxID=280406 RepID=A0AAV2AE19_9ARAC